MVIVLYYSLYVCLEQSIIIEDYCFESTVLFHLQTSITIFRRIQLHKYHQIHTGIYSKISTLIVNNINQKRKEEILENNYCICDTCFLPVNHSCFNHYWIILKNS